MFPESIERKPEVIVPQEILKRRDYGIVLPCSVG